MDARFLKRYSLLTQWKEMSVGKGYYEAVSFVQVSTVFLYSVLAQESLKKLRL